MAALSALLAAPLALESTLDAPLPAVAAAEDAEERILEAAEPAEDVMLWIEFVTLPSEAVTEEITLAIEESVMPGLVIGLSCAIEIATRANTTGVNFMLAGS